jgi:hypothetical protein
MPIQKTITAPNGASLAFHKVRSANIDYASGQAHAQVASWPSEQAHNDGLPLAWMWTVLVPIAGLSDEDTALLQAPNSPFIGGVKAVDQSAELPAFKARKNAEINGARLVANRLTFTFAGKEISCDELSRGDIDGVNGIVALTGALPPGFPGAWKATDNSYVPIPNVTTWIQLYGAMVSKGTANFAHSQSLKAQLEAATTNEEVEAIQW